MSLCIGCMHEIGNEIICPDCGFDNSLTQSAPFLPYGVVLDKRYVVGKEIETNGESTMYIGFDRQTSKPVLIREFLPAGFYSREEGHVKLNVDADKKEDFLRLLSDFEKFFSFLSTLRDMSAMNVITDIFRANNTCYVVEEYEDLISFEEYVSRNNGHLEWEVARPLFMPIISLLEALHKNGFGHYAISPTNIYITTSGKALLLGFATINERRRGTALKSQLFTGCAAPEQYEKSFPIDNITDIYGFTATLFYALTGALPAGAKERLTDGALLMSTSTVKRLPPHVVSALANGLQVKREERIIDFGDLRSQLSVAPTVKAIQEEISRTASMTNSIKPPKKKFGMSPISVGIIVTVVASLLFLVIGMTIVNSIVNKTPDIDSSEDTVVSSTISDPEPDDFVQWDGEVFDDYVGRSFESVKNELEQKGVTVYEYFYNSDSDGYDDNIAAGTITEQIPQEGAPMDVERGVAITFKVSRGSRTVTLPDFGDDTPWKTAVDKLTDLGFNVSYSGYQPHKTAAKDCVIGYSGSYQAGDKVQRGTTIGIVISSGPDASDSSADNQ